MIPTVICGRWNRFSSLYPETIQLRKVRNNFDTGLASQEELTVAQNSVVQLLLEQLEACQVTITTSGGIRWDSIYDITRRIVGCHSFTQLTRLPETNQFHRQPMVSLPLQWVESLYQDDFFFAKQHTHLPLCFSLPGPFSTALQTQNIYSFGVEQIANHYAQVFNQELKHLLHTKGISFVRIEEPHLFSHPQEFTKFQALMAKLTQEIDPSRLALASTKDISSFDRYFELPFGIFFLDFVREKNRLAILRHFPAWKKLVAGVVDTHHTYNKDPCEIKQLIRRILNYVSRDSLALSGNADWHFLPWSRAMDKVKKLVEVGDAI